MKEIRSVKSPRTVVAILVAAALVTLAGCGAPAPAVVAAPGVQPKPCGTVTIVDNPWAGYEANLAVVDYLLRHELGCNVVTKNMDEVTGWKNLAAGKIDAILENWGHDDLRKQYIDKQQVAVEAGLTGNKGVIGWFLPPWMAKQYPDITKWQNLAKYAYLFKTPKTGSKGQFLDGDPTYVTNDAALIKNLKLPYKVVYAGSEDKLITAFRAAQKNHTALLGYFYSPQWFLSEVQLTHIDLPPYTPGCDTDLATITCDYQPYDLDKIENKKFAYSGSPAAELIQNFSWTDADQDAVARDITENHLSDDAAAKKWLDAHPTVWKSWIPSAG
jgi:glycine betaine/proline transport system substrate-binding protein